MIDAADAEFMTRLFGPRIPGSMKEMFEDAKGVDFEGDDYKSPLAVLIANVVYRGLDGGICAGWSFTEREDGRLSIAVCRFKEALAA